MIVVPNSWSHDQNPATWQVACIYDTCSVSVSHDQSLAGLQEAKSMKEDGFA